MTASDAWARFAELPRTTARAMAVGLAEVDTCAECRGRIMGWMFDVATTPPSPGNLAVLVPPVLCADDTVKVGAFLVRFQAGRALDLGRAWFDAVASFWFPKQS